MTDLRDKLIALDREGLEQEAARLGISVTESMSRAELIIAIETVNAHHELGAIQSFREYRVLISGLILVTIATIVWAFDTYLLLAGLHVIFFDVVSSLIPSLIYWVLRALGGCLIAAALISLAFKKGDERMTPVVRGALITVTVLIIIIVIISIPFPGNWLTMYP
ncbi:hypothetical protein E2P64_07235 [Candidatus Bathyarchaeota archaeon]|nr:hypothetical protein E2P64_07235 [Candidatus Bathyarchaeota archaeon]